MRRRLRETRRRIPRTRPRPGCVLLPLPLDRTGDLVSELLARIRDLERRLHAAQSSRNYWRSLAREAVTHSTQRAAAHGTAARYSSYKWRCRCVKCRAANRDRIREYRKQRAARV